MPSAVPRATAALVRVVTVVLLSVGLVVAVPATAAAHTGLRATEPAADSTATTTPQAVVLTFSASVLGGEITVTGPDGTSVGAGTVAHDGAVLTAPVDLAAAGRHTVTWSAVARDGHILDGTFDFEHAPAAPLPTTAAPPPPATAPATATADAPAPEASPATGTGTSDTGTSDTGTPDTGTPDTGTAPASSGGGLPGWGLPAAAVALLAAGALAVLRRRRR